MQKRGTFLLTLLLLAGGAHAGAQELHEVELRDRVLRLPAGDWRAVDTGEPYAARFERRTRQPGETFPEILTIVRLPMQVTDRLGVALTFDEHVDFAYLYPVKVTVRVRLDRESFWIESVRTLEVPEGTPLPVPWRMYQPPTELEALTLAAFYDAEIRQTRFRLRQLADGSSP